MDIANKAWMFGDFAIMIAAGVVMHKGKVWGVVFAVVFYLFLRISDLIMYTAMTVNNNGVRCISCCISVRETIWPAILFYFNCAMAIIIKSKNKK